jgi:hypothetical protein
MAWDGQKTVFIMLRHWFLLGAVLLTFFFLFVPSVLWLTDRFLRKALEQRLFVVNWHPLWMLMAGVCWLVWALFNDY